MAWIQPIFYSTQSDIDNKTSKGYLNIEDLNRIENNIQYLGGLVGADVTTILWTHDTLPTKAQFDRILDDLTNIKNKWWSVTEDNPSQPINVFEKVNTIEKILFDTYKNYIEWNHAILRCGEGYANNYDII